MIVTSVELSTFRNYETLKVDLAPGINVFYGLNAQGKTNILEAVYLCACARSHRTSRDSDMIKSGHDQYGVRITFTDSHAYGQAGRQADDHAGSLAEGQADRQVGSQQLADSLEIRYLEADPRDPRRSRPQRLVSHNGMRLEKISELMGLFHAVIFAPEDLMLIKEGPATRRRYLDLLLSQVRPTYFQDLQLFNRLLLQRNRLLKEFRGRLFARPGKDLLPDELLQLETWDHALSGSMGRLIRRRQEYAARISEFAGRSHASISSGRERLSVRYRTISGIRPDMTDSEIHALILEKLRATLMDDVEKGVTGIGPHRDDLEINLDGESLKPYASQGQQRSAVLSLKLAELEIIREDTGELPVLLLDDVMSELDVIRRHSLLEGIEHAQVLLTCTDRAQVNRQFDGTEAGSFTYYEVSGATVTQDVR